MKKTAVFAVLAACAAIAVAPMPVDACTVAVISGKATPDGKPLLWKNRDTSHQANKMMFFRGEKFDYIAVVNSEDKDFDKVWAGVNSAGFCIMNSLSYNVNLEEKDKELSPEEKKDQITEGRMMKLALERCASVADFDKLLEETAGKRGIETNFGVIDADDPKVAHEGYIIRTNYCFMGEPNRGAGYIRYDRISKLFHEGVSNGGITPTWLLNAASRDMVNNLSGVDPLAQPLPAHSRDRRLYYMNDSLARPSATSTTLFQGVKTGDDPVGTIMWSRLGHPLCSVALPLWVAGGERMKIVTGEKNAPIDDFALYWLSRIYPLKGGSRGHYLDLAPLMNAAGDGILPRLIAIEERIITETAGLIASTAGLDAEKAAAIQVEIENLAAELLRAEFPEAAAAAGL